MLPPGGGLAGPGEGGGDLAGDPLQVGAGRLVANAGGATPEGDVGEGKLRLELAQGGGDAVGGVAEDRGALQAGRVDRGGARFAAVGAPVAVAVELVGDGRGQFGG